MFAIDILYCRFLLGRWKQALDVFIKAESLLQRADAEVYYYIGKKKSFHMYHIYHI